MESLNIKRKNVIDAILSYAHTPVDHLKEIQNKSDEELFFHLEQFCLLCKDDFKEVLKNFNCISFDLVNKDNIHLYYEFMSDKDISNIDYKLFEVKSHTVFIYDIFHYRKYTILKDLKIDYKNSDDIAILTQVVFKLGKYTKLSTTGGLIFFGVKDTLKPIDEYIAEIKESSEYKEYISKIS